MLRTSLANQRTFLSAIRTTGLLIGTCLLINNKWLIIINCIILIWATYSYYKTQSIINKKIIKCKDYNPNEVILYNCYYLYTILLLIICILFLIK